MIWRAGTGWQTTTADLALILFLVVSAAGVQEGGAGKAGGPPPPIAIETTPPAGIYRLQAATSLPQWLQAQAFDERQVATVLVKQPAPGASTALQQGLVFLAQIEASGRTGRLIIEKGAVDEVSVVLAYDSLPASGTALAAR